jgi:hypothetical protein
VRVTPDGRVEIESRGGQREAAALAPAVDRPTRVVSCRARSSASALVGLVSSDVLVLASAQDFGLRRCALGERIPNAEQLQIVPVEGAFAVIYENGIALIDDAGRERWRIDRVCFDWRFVDERDGALWLADHDGNLLGFDAATGFERA